MWIGPVRHTRDLHSHACSKGSLKDARIAEGMGNDQLAR